LSGLQGPTYAWIAYAGWAIFLLIDSGLTEMMGMANAHPTNLVYFANQLSGMKNARPT